MSNRFDEAAKLRLLCSLAGQEFKTKLGRPFVYEISNDVLLVSRTEYNIPMSDVKKALSLVPIKGPGEITQAVRGPSYIWAILHDPRVRQDDW